MGAWGTGIWSDDYTLDIKEDYMCALRIGKTPEEALSELLEKEKPEQDTEYGHLFWVAIALTQWKYGHLRPNVKERALSALSTNADEMLWSSASLPDQKKRKKVILAVEEKLNSEQPPEKKIARAKGKKDPFKIGDIVAVKTPQDAHILQMRGMDEFIDTYCLFHVVDHCYYLSEGYKSDIYDRCTVAYVYNWFGTLPENFDFVENLELLNVEKYAMGKKGRYLHNYCFNLHVYAKVFFERANAKVVASNQNFRRFENLPEPYGWNKPSLISSIAAEFPYWIANRRNGIIVERESPTEIRKDEHGNYKEVTITDEELRERGKHFRRD